MRKKKESQPEARPHDYASLADEREPHPGRSPEVKSGRDEAGPCLVDAKPQRHELKCNYDGPVDELENEGGHKSPPPSDTRPPAQEARGRDRGVAM